MMGNVSKGWQLIFKLGMVFGLVALIGARTVRTPGSTAAASRQGQDVPLPEPNAAMERKDFSRLGAPAVAAVRAGVLAMMQRDCTVPVPPLPCPANKLKADADLSPLGWKYQASIHGSLPGSNNQTAWNTCQHSTWFFLSWHRMELYFFERILRAQSGSNTLTLPYWNFTVPEPDQSANCVAQGKPANCVGARLPKAFRERPGMQPLWWPFRADDLNTAPPAAGNDTAQPLCRDVVTTAQAFAQKAFFTNVLSKGGMSFGGGAKPTPRHGPGGIGGGQIERVPHDVVHGAVGDGKGGMSMANPGGAALDPIFWPVHANIDRAWSCWQRLHPGSEPKSDIWMKDEKFDFFDVRKKDDGTLEAVAVSMSGQDIIDTAKQLGYVYDNACQGFDLPARSSEAAQPSLLAEEAASVGAPGGALTATAVSHATLGKEPVTVEISLTTSLRKRIQALVPGNVRPGSILLTVGGLAVDQPTGAAYGIYLNLPEGVTPDYQSDYYADRLPFFGVGHHHGHDEAGSDSAADPTNSISYDVTNLVSRLVANGEWRGDHVAVTFAPAPAAEPPCVQVAPATPQERARFAYVSLTVE